MKRLLFISLLMIASITSYGQNKCDQVLLKGKVEDSLNPQSFYNLMVVNRTKGKGNFGQPNGYFSVYVFDNDSVSISVKGYSIIDFRIHADSNCQYIVSKYIDRIVVELKEVVIIPLKSLEQIKEERQGLAMRETRMVTGIEQLQSPITALYQRFSKKEKNKRWIAEQEFKDNERQVVKELLRLYVAYDIINLTDEEFDDFISFLNINETFLKTATEMELITFVKDKFDHFQRMNNITFEENNSWKTELEVDHDVKNALMKVIRLYVSHKIIALPETEFERFITFLNIKEPYLKTATDSELRVIVQDKHKKYIHFYKL